MKKGYPKRTCAARDCEKQFTPKYRWEIYHSARCASRERQARLRERLKKPVANPEQQEATA